LNVSEYTDKVDILAWRSKTSRVHVQIKDFCAILSGLVVAQDYKRGQQLVADRDFDENADFFQVSPALLPGLLLLVLLVLLLVWPAAVVAVRRLMSAFVQVTAGFISCHAGDSWLHKLSCQRCFGRGC
jgi:hypothetical protein